MLMCALNHNNYSREHINNLNIVRLRTTPVRATDYVANLHCKCDYVS